MSQSNISYTPVGIVHSGHVTLEQIPIQPVYAKGCTGTAELFPEYETGLRDIEGFSHLYLIYHFHMSKTVNLLVKPFLQDVGHGVFATRAPGRPNSIGLSIVRLVRREGNILFLDDLDILDGTPLLDIKPYTARFDRIETTRNGWQDEIDDTTANRRGMRGYKNIPESG